MKTKQRRLTVQTRPDQIKSIDRELKRKNSKANERQTKNILIKKNHQSKIETIESNIDRIEIQS